jgi:hypothetical protein
MTSRKLASTALALVLPLGLSCAAEPEADEVAGPLAEEHCIEDENPHYYPGNPSCEDLGLVNVFSVKHDFGVGDDATITLTVPGYGTITFTHDGFYVDWSSTLGIDAVIVKGGPNANVWFYDPESFGDQDLASPINGNTGIPYGLSHVDFCFDYEVEVKKTAETTYDRAYDWSIAKTAYATITAWLNGEAPLTTLLLNPSTSYQYVYVTTVTNSPPIDSDFAVEGTITIRNPAPIPASIVGVSDVFGDVTIPVTCSKAIPATLEPLEVMTCTYALELPGMVEGENVATVTTIGKVGGATATAMVDFGDPTTVIDECIAVNDHLVATHIGTGDVLGERFLTLATSYAPVCVDAPEEDKTFGYLYTAGPFEVCGEVGIHNVASYVSTEAEPETGSDDHDVLVTIDCPVGCTLTQGYWKTHSDHGPAPYDEVWALLGEDTLFFKSGKTYHQVLWTPPKGNPYWTLAHQYIAAKLNILAGATGSEVATALSNATNLFDTCTPGMVTKRGGSCPASTFTSLAATLDQYNNGYIGPGHCSE